MPLTSHPETTPHKAPCNTRLLLAQQDHASTPDAQHRSLQPPSQYTGGLSPTGDSPLKIILSSKVTGCPPHVSNPSGVLRGPHTLTTSPFLMLALTATLHVMLRASSLPPFYASPHLPVASPPAEAASGQASSLFFEATLPYPLGTLLLCISLAPFLQDAQPTCHHRSISQQGLLVFSKALIVFVQLLQLLQCFLGRRFVVQFPIQLIIVFLHMRFLCLLSHDHLVWVAERSSQWDHSVEEQRPWGHVVGQSPGSQAGTCPALNSAGSSKANGDSDRLQSRHRRADIEARTQPPPAPTPLPAGTAHTQTYTSLPSRGGGAGAEAETGVIYSCSAARSLAGNPAITSHRTRLQRLPEISHKEPTATQRGTET